MERESLELTSVLPSLDIGQLKFGNQAVGEFEPDMDLVCRDQRSGVVLHACSKTIIDLNAPITEVRAVVSNEGNAPFQHGETVTRITSIATSIAKPRPVRKGIDVDIVRSSGRK